MKQIDFPAIVHLTSNELEVRDLTLSLPVGPGQSDCRPHCRLILGDAIGERSDETGASAPDPRDEVDLGFAPDHQMEFSDDLTGLDQRWCARFDRRDRDGLCFRRRARSKPQRAVLQFTRDGWVRNGGIINYIDISMMYGFVVLF